MDSERTGIVPTPPPSGETVDSRLRAAQVRQLYSQAPAGAMAAIATAIILVVLLWEVVPKLILIGWLAGYLGIQVPRHALIRAFHKAAPAGAAALPWGGWIVLSTWASGLAWGLAGVVLLPAASMVHQLVVAISLAGIAAAATGIYSPTRECYLPTILLILLPLAGRFVYDGGEASVTMGVLIGLYALVLGVTGNLIHLTNTESLKLRFENTELIERLTEEKAYAERLGENLKVRVTELKRTQDDLQTAHDELETRVARRTAELVSTNERLQLEIADRQRVEESLRESEERYRLLTQHSLTGIYIHEGGVLLYANERFGAILGYRPEEIIGRRVQDLVHPVDWDAVMNPVVNPLAGDATAPMYEFRALCKDGKPKWVAVLVGTITHRGKTAHMGNMADISERKRAEQALYRAHEDLEQRVRQRTGQLKQMNDQLRFEIADRERAEEELRRNEQRFRSLFESATEFIYLLDTEGKIVQANPEALRRLGYSEEELLGTPLMDLLTEESKRIYRLGIFTLLEDGFNRKELELVCKGNEVITVDSTASAIRDENGKIGSIVEFQRDVTEQKRARLAAEVATKELQRALAASAALRAEAEASNRSKSEFLANMSHELRTPLNAIIGFSEILIDQIFAPLDERQLKYVGHILAAGRHLLQLINDILDLAKVESGHMELQHSVVTVSLLLDESLAQVSPTAAYKRLRFELNVAPELQAHPVLADHLRLKQILVNLLSNAVKFTPDDGEVRVETRMRGDNLVVAVADTGIGIDREDQERIFDTFVQVDSSYSRSQEGSGLGLSLTRSLVELHGGRISVQSEGPGKGSLFTVEIPVVRASEAPVAFEKPDVPENVPLPGGPATTSMLDALFLSGPPGSDDLARIRNQPAIHDILKREVSRAAREFSPLGLVIAEVKGAPEVDRQHGRVAREAVMREVARHMESRSRPYDSVGRYGGDRLIMVLPGCDRNHTRLVVDRLCASLAASPVTGPYGSFPVSLTVGFAAYEGKGACSVKDLLEAGEGALQGVKDGVGATRTGEGLVC